MITAKAIGWLEMPMLFQGAFLPKPQARQGRPSIKDLLQEYDIFASEAYIVHAADLTLYLPVS